MLSKALKACEKCLTSAEVGLYSPVQSLLALIRPEPGTLVKVIENGQLLA